jgi:putative Mg2+ transporter-C (MgtC) family protein
MAYLEVKTMAQDILSFMPAPLNYIVRILIAAACGFAIGFQRKQRSKEAGIRTHAIVALGACLMMIISKYAFWDSGDGKFDGSRIASQVVSGIGFIGTGMIVYSKGALHGLTTAAGIWATAGVGMCVGAGGNTMLIVGVSATVIIVAVHLFLHMPFRIFRSTNSHQIQVQFKATDNAVDEIKRIFKATRSFRMRITSDGKEKIGTILLRTTFIPSDNDWQKIMDEHPYIISMEYFEEEWQ